jgi:segregation and condensation protein B
MDLINIKNIIEVALLSAGKPLSMDDLNNILEDGQVSDKSELKKIIDELKIEYDAKGLEIKEVATGFRIQLKSDMTKYLSKLWEIKSPRYSRALFETLALIAYRQPITRGEIEEVRGVSMSTNIIRTLAERNWIRVVGHRDVPGRPEMFATTKEFLDYFGLKKLDQLPPLKDLSDWESLRIQLDLPEVDEIIFSDEPPDSIEIKYKTENLDEEIDPQEIGHAEIIADSNMEDIIPSQAQDEQSNVESLITNPEDKDTR